MTGWMGRVGWNSKYNPLYVVNSGLLIIYNYITSDELHNAHLRKLQKWTIKEKTLQYVKYEKKSNFGSFHEGLRFKRHPNRI